MKLVDKNLLKNDLQSNKLQIMSSLLVGILIVVMAFISLQNELGFARSNTPSEFTFNFNSSILSFYTLITLLFGAILFFTSMTAFNFFKSKEKVDFYNQLPVKRETMFFTKYLATILSSLIPYLITILVYFIMYNILLRSNFKISEYNYHLFISLIKISIWGVFFFTLSAFCASITGKVSGHCTILMAIVFVPQMLISFVFMFLQMSINEGITVSSYSTILDKIINLGPSSYTFSPLYVFIIIALTIALLFVSLKIYKNYKSENAGKFITYDWLNEFFNYFVAFVVSIATISIYSGIINISYNYKGYMQKVAIFFIIFIASFIIWYVIIKSIKQARFTKSIINIKSMGIILAVSIVFLSISFLDILNIREYIPNPSNVESVTINNDTFRDAENIKIVEDIQKLCIENEQMNLESYDIQYYGDKGTYSYSISYDDDTIYTSILYKTKSGEVSRRYVSTFTDEVYYLNQKLYASNEYKQNMLANIDTAIDVVNKETKIIKERSSTEFNGGVYIDLNSVLNYSDTCPVEGTDRLEFLEALKLDIENDDNFTNYSNQEIPFYRVLLNLNAPDPNTNYSNYSYIECDIKPTYKNTINFINESTTLKNYNDDLTFITFKNSDDNVKKEGALNKGVHFANCQSADNYEFYYDKEGTYTDKPAQEAIELIKNDPKNSEISIINSIENPKEMETFLSETKPYCIDGFYYLAKISENTDVYRIYVLNNNENKISYMGSFTK